MRQQVIDEPGRLDVHVSAIQGGRTAAKEIILRGDVAINGVTALKPSARVRPGDMVTVSAPPREYASRGGHKLAAALEAFGVNTEGKTCLDVGASTGGFTDCLLQHGAAKVFAVDTGTGQLTEPLRQDIRVVSMEQTNINNLSASDFPEQIQFACVDVSFVSITKVMRAIFNLIPRGGQAVFLVKPQFEAGRSRIGKNGLVKNKNVHEDVLTDVCAAAAELGFPPCALIRSPITGGSGNIEYLMFFDFTAVGLTAETFATVCKKAVFG